MSSRRIRDVPLPSSIIPTLAAYSELSTLYSYVNSSTTLYNLLNDAQNFTFLAPTNDAIEQWIVSNGNVTPAADVIEAQLSYHLLNGSFPTVDFTTAPQFVATDLANSSYNNVTTYPGGQRVELITNDGNPEIISSNKTATTISMKDVVCLNGLVQFVNSVLSIPIALVLLTAQANMSFFIAILNRANFLSVNDAGLIEFVNYASFTPNMTFFVPNTAQALASFNGNFTSNVSATDLLAAFDYHIVPGQVLYSPDLVNGTVLKTTQGDNLTITTVGDDTYVNTAKILVSDYLIVNGVIHTIDDLLDHFNQSIPLAAIAPSNSTTSHSSGLSTGAKVAIGVVIPVVVLAALAGLFFWLWRKKKAKRTQAELDSTAAAGPSAGEMGTNPAAREMGTNDPTANELHSPDVKKELHGDAAPGELPNESRPQELAGGVNSLPPVELE